METEFKDYYDYLKEYLDSHNGDYEEIVNYGPEIFKLISNILNEKIIPSEHRLKLSAALGYFVAPFDIIPELIYGPEGYIDDIFLCVYVIKMLAEEIGYESIENLWDEDEKLRVVIERCYSHSKLLLGEKCDLILAYTGIR